MEGGTEGRRVRRSEGAREEESVDGGKGEWRGWRGWRAGEEGCVSHLKRILSVAISAQASASFLRTFSLFLEPPPYGRGPVLFTVSDYLHGRRPVLSAAPSATSSSWQHDR